MENEGEFDEIKGVVSWDGFSLGAVLTSTLGTMRLCQGWGTQDLVVARERMKCDGYRKRIEQRDIKSRRSNRCGRKSGNVADLLGSAGVGYGVSFRKKGCGIEGKWKGGQLG